MAPTRLRAAFRCFHRVPAMAPGAVYSDGGTVTLSSNNVSSNAAQGGQGGSLISGSLYCLGVARSGGSGSAGGLCASAGTRSREHLDTVRAISPRVAAAGRSELVPTAPSAALHTGVRFI